MNTPVLNIAVGIATAGRRDILERTIRLLGKQSRAPDRLIVCPLPSDGVDPIAFADFPAPVSVVTGSKGLCAQRNMILNAASGSDVIVFFDDDFLAEANYLRNLEDIFISHPDITALTGHLLADGAHGPGYSIDQGLQILAANHDEPQQRLEPLYGTYGCNMAFRLGPIQADKIRFDENLPLYGWQEDIDFSIRQAPFGRIAKSYNLIGVHLGVKSGRNSGVRLGYSQIANPIYLTRKGTMSWKHARMLMWRNIAANLVRSIYPEHWIDRKGRLKGNLIAIWDLMTGRLCTLRVMQLG
jgi:glycosyltransferase involved in cell wall biosynthesis